MDYSNFSDAKAQYVQMNHCSLRESVFHSCRWKNWNMTACKLHGCEFTGTSLNDMDVTDCETGMWQVDLHALRGLKVTKEQAVSFAGLLGLKIMDL